MGLKVISTYIRSFTMYGKSILPYLSTRIFSLRDSFTTKKSRFAENIFRVQRLRHLFYLLKKVGGDSKRSIEILYESVGL